MSDKPEDIPVSTHQGSFTLFGVELKCHRLSNGKAVVEEESVNKLFEVISDPGHQRLDNSELKRFIEWQRGMK